MRVSFLANAVAVRAVDVPRLMDAAGVAFHEIACINWPAYPYAPAVKFRIAHTGEAVLLHYVVDESDVRGCYAEDDSPVWTDSCVEFFFAPAEDGMYYNLECNCIGTVLLGGGLPRPNHERAGEEVTRRIDRWASLGRTPFDTRKAEVAWEVALVVPTIVFFKHHLTSFRGLSARANFYKCGDELPQPHFLSWAPIELPKPNFHCPEFFAPLEFEKGREG